MKVLAAIPIAAALVLSACGGAEDPDPAAPPDTPTTVDVTALDFDFQTSPEAVPAGEVELTLRNEGEQPHQLIIYPLDEGVAFDEFKSTVMKDQKKFPDFTGSPLVSLTLYRALGTGEEDSADGELEAGSYALVCWVRDPETSKTHVELGMIIELVVR